MQSGAALLGAAVLPRGTRGRGAWEPTDVEDGPWNALLADLERQVGQLMDKAGVPGLSIAIVRDGNLLWRRAFGLRNVASKAPVDNDTVFEAASTSKPLFAYVVMKLCERGVMNLDTPLTKYTDRRFLQGDARLDLITARMVLSHTSGFPNWRSKEEPLAIHFTPGSQWSYSGEGYSYLQAVVTHLIGGRAISNECAPFEDDLRVCATAPNIND